MMTIKKWCAGLLVGLVGLGSAQAASNIPMQYGQRPCWDEAARYHGLDPWLLYSVAYVESTHNPTVISRPNSNGSYDIGLMQINSAWLPKLQQYGITQNVLMNACASTYVGAWVMAQNIRRYGYSWKAIAAYNVGSVDDPRRQRLGYTYARKVYAAYERLTRTHPRVAMTGAPPGPTIDPTALARR